MINKAILMGRLTRDPELRHTGTGTPVCSFSVAVDNGYGENKRTDFINCVAWNKTAEFVTNYFGKGKMIIVDGRIQSRSWEDQNGEKRYATEVIAERVGFGETKTAESGTSGGQGGYGNSQGGYGNNYGVPPPPAGPNNYGQNAARDFGEAVDDDLPF